MSRFELVAEESQVWIDGSSSLHPVRATATGVRGWFELDMNDGVPADAPGLAGEIRVEVAKLQSGNPLVDRETRRRVDARRHPEIVGTVTGARREAADRLEVTGDLAFRGVVRQVAGTVTVVQDGDRLVLAGSQTFDVRDWGLDPPRVAMLRVHPEVTVRIRLVAREVQA